MIGKHETNHSNEFYVDGYKDYLQKWFSGKVLKISLMARSFLTIVQAERWIKISIGECSRIVLTIL